MNAEFVYKNCFKNKTLLKRISTQVYRHSETPKKDLKVLTNERRGELKVVLINVGSRFRLLLIRVGAANMTLPLIMHN